MDGLTIPSVNRCMMDSVGESPDDVSDDTTLGWKSIWSALMRTETGGASEGEEEEAPKDNVHGLMASILNHAGDIRIQSVLLGDGVQGERLPLSAEAAMVIAHQHGTDNPGVSTIEGAWPSLLAFNEEITEAAAMSFENNRTINPSSEGSDRPFGDRTLLRTSADELLSALDNNVAIDEGTKEFQAAINDATGQRIKKAMSSLVESISKGSQLSFSDLSESVDPTHDGTNSFAKKHSALSFDQTKAMLQVGRWETPGSEASAKDPVPSPSGNIARDMTGFEPVTQEGGTMWTGASEAGSPVLLARAGEGSMIAEGVEIPRSVPLPSEFKMPDNPRSSLLLRIDHDEGGSMRLRLSADRADIMGQIRTEDPLLLRELWVDIENLHRNLHQMGYDRVDMDFASSSESHPDESGWQGDDTKGSRNEENRPDEMTQGDAREENRETGAMVNRTEKGSLNLWA